MKDDLHAREPEPPCTLEDRGIVVAATTEDRIDDARAQAAIISAHPSLEWGAATAVHERPIRISNASFSTRSGDGASSPAAQVVAAPAGARLAPN